MSYNSLWQEWQRFFRRQRQPRPSHRRCRPILEELETRAVPSGLPPTANNIGGLSVLHGQTLQGIDLIGACSDPESDPLMVTVITQPSHGMVTYNQASGRYDYTAMGFYEGPDSFTFQAFDGTGQSNIATVSINVTNNAPVITDAGSDWDFVEGEQVSIQIQASDADFGDMLTYSAENLPDGLSINSYTGLISGTVLGHNDPDPTRPYQVRIRVTDGIDEDDVFLQAGATAFRMTSAVLTAPPGFTGTLGTTPRQFTCVISGVGAPPAGLDIRWSVYDNDDWDLDDQLQDERIVNTGAGAGATGTWSVTVQFWLQSNTNLYVAGADGHSGQTSAEVYVHVEKNNGSDLGMSNIVNITGTSSMP